MSPDKTLTDMHKRLDDLERRLADKEAQIGRTGAIPAHHRARIDEMQAKARAVREKLPDSAGSQWDAAKHELEADVDALSHVMEHWAAHVDEEFKHLK